MNPCSQYSVQHCFSSPFDQLKNLSTVSNISVNAPSSTQLPPAVRNQRERLYTNRKDWAGVGDPVTQTRYQKNPKNQQWRPEQTKKRQKKTKVFEYDVTGRHPQKSKYKITADLTMKSSDDGWFPYYNNSEFPSLHQSTTICSAYCNCS